MERQISRYEILSLLGQGGLGVVYKARDPDLDKIVAIKMIGSSELNEQQVVRFHREAKVLTDLRHSKIPEVYNFAISSAGVPYMVMEYVEGKNLAELIEKHGTLSVEQATSIVSQLCDALQYAHGQGIVHRDVKPSNVILKEDEAGELSVKLVDFGIAKIEMSIDEGQDLTRTGEAIGSPYYMSPEQIHSQQMDGRSDIYSLGCVIYEMLTGSPPYVGNTALSTITKHLTEEPEPPSSRVDLGGRGEELDRIVLTCLAKEPEKRFQCASVLASNLNESTETKVFEPLISIPEQVDQKSTQRPWILAAAGLLIVFLASVVITNLVSEQEAINQPRQVAHQDYLTGTTFDKEIGKHVDIPWTQVKFAYKDENNETRHLKTYRGNTKLTDDDFKLLPEDAEGIATQYSEVVTGEGFKYLVGRNLVMANIASISLTDRGLAELSKVSSLTSVKLSLGKKLSDRGFLYLKNLPMLMGLHIYDTTLTNKTYKYIAEMGALKVLTLRPLIPLTDKDLLALSASNTLEALSVDGMVESSRKVHVQTITDSQLSIIPRFKRLKRLLITGQDLSDKNLEALSQTKLIWLDLSGNKITNRGLMKVAKIKSLRVLKIAGCPGITTVGLNEFESKRDDCNVHTEPNFSLESSAQVEL